MVQWIHGAMYKETKIHNTRDTISHYCHYRCINQYIANQSPHPNSQDVLDSMDCEKIKRYSVDEVVRTARQGIVVNRICSTTVNSELFHWKRRGCMPEQI
eukprot:188241_1